MLFGLPLLEIDEVMDRIDAVTLDDLRALVDELWAPERAVGGRHRPGRGRASARGRRAGVCPGRGAARGMIRVAVAGAAGRMGQTVCAAVEGADDMELTGRADPALGTPLADVLGDADVVVDFTQPDTGASATRARRSRPACTSSIGTTGFDLDELRAAVAGAPANVFVAPNFAIGAVLMMRFAAEASRHMAARRDHRVPPPGQARRAVGHRRPHRRADGRRRADPLGAPARASSPTRT